MVDTSPTVCTPRDPPWPPLPSRCIRLHTTRPRYPITPRVFRRALRHPPATCSPNPRQGPCVSQVGPFLCLFPIVGPEFGVRLLRWALCPHPLRGHLSSATEAGLSHRPPHFPPLCPSCRPRGVTVHGPSGVPGRPRSTHALNRPVPALPAPPRGPAGRPRCRVSGPRGLSRVNGRNPPFLAAQRPASASDAAAARSALRGR